MLQHVFTLQSSITTPTTGDRLRIARQEARFTVQVTVAGTGSVETTVDIYASNILTGPGGFLGTITLADDDIATDGFVVDAPCQYVWSDVTAISGSSAAVDVVVGV